MKRKKKDEIFLRPEIGFGMTLLKNLKDKNEAGNLLRKVCKNQKERNLVEEAIKDEITQQQVKKDKVIKEKLKLTLKTKNKPIIME